MGHISHGEGAELPRTVDVVVVGGGIAGAADAYYLGRLGLSVLVLERGSQMAGLTTAQSVACFRAQWDEADYASLVLPSIDFYGQFGETVGLPGWDIGLRRQGWLFLTAAEDGPETFARFVEAHRGFGVVDSELLVRDAIRARFPWVGPAATAGTFRRADGWVSPYEVTYGFARASSADVHLRTTALEIETESGRVVGVRSDRGQVAAPMVVIAGGPFSARLAATAGITLPVTMVRRHRAMFGPQPEIPSDGPMVVDVDTSVYWRPEGGGAFMGQGLPEEGSEPVEQVPVDWTFPAVAVDAAGRLVPFWSQIAERLHRDDVSLAAGQYTCTLDGRPIIGGSSIDGLFFHTGDNGWGVESAPEAARRLAEIVTGGREEPENPYRLSRPGLTTPQTHKVTY